ncbi:hypothetical protein BN2475_140030 [Paraburkholderia ribeironis]|uniref:Uncharacterized protein n=1 Tax=Paraburkholderia ribeironis TaxID=1247936 RepID=A0A1N7RSR0_9BURK|nr:hypothetical protein BN2475_140030 [Paraburkholderia ribeironis]
MNFMLLEIFLQAFKTKAFLRTRMRGGNLCFQALPGPEVEYLAKGKVPTPLEFGVKLFDSESGSTGTRWRKACIRQGVGTGEQPR